MTDNLMIEILANAFQDGPKYSGFEKTKKEIIYNRMKHAVNALNEHGYEIVKRENHECRQLLATMQREAKLLEALLRADTELRKLGRSESNNTRIFIKQVLSCENSHEW